MPFYIRKSISLGPLRLNFSKTGIGASVGVKGLRLGSGARGNYVHMGREGLYYRKTLSGQKIPTAHVFENLVSRLTQKNSPAENAPESVIHSATTKSTSRSDDLLDIDSVDVCSLVDADSQDLLRELEQKRTRSDVWPYVGFGAAAVVVLLLLLSVPGWVSIVLLVIGAFATYAVQQWDATQRHAVLFYDLDGEIQAQYKKLYNSFEKISSSGKFWHVAATALPTDPIRGGNAGAQAILNETLIRFGDGPRRLRTNVSIPSVSAGKEHLHFFPDRILIESGDRYGAVAYRDLAIEIAEVEFQDNGPVDPNARVVRKFWKFSNKDGTPDRRYKLNTEISIVLHDRILLKSDAGLKEAFQISQPQLAHELRESLAAIA